MSKNKVKKNVKVEVPLSLLVDKAPLSDTRTIKDLWDMEKDIDRNPPYQRNDVWDSVARYNLINSILHNIPINAIHLVKKPDGDGGENYIVLDGKQRLTSIFDYMKNLFSVKMKFDPKLGESIDVEYKDLKKWASEESSPNHAKAKKILRDFHAAKVIVLFWPDMDLTEQSIVFNAINYGVQLSTDEKKLARYFNSKVFCQYLLKNDFKSLSFKDQDRKRSKDYIWALKLLYVLFNGKTDMLDVNYDKIGFTEYAQGFEPFLYELHNKIEKYLTENATQILKSYEDKSEMIKMLTKFGWTEDFKDVSSFITDICSKIMSASNFSNLGRKDVGNWIKIYFISFIVNKYDKKILSYGKFSENIVSFNNIFADYYQWTKETVSDSDDSFSKYKTRRMPYNKTVSVHMAKLQELYQLHIVDAGIMDDNPKSAYISPTDKREALKRANGKCEACKEDFTPIDEIHFDHMHASSAFANPGKILAMHKKCNRQKSDNDIHSAQNIVDLLSTQKTGT